MIKIAITIVGCGSSGSAIAAQLAKKQEFLAVKSFINTVSRKGLGEENEKNKTNR